MAKQIMDIPLNLVENAFDAIADQGGVSTIKALSAYPNLQIEVPDTGSIIPSEHQSRIFNMFSSARENRGSGLWEPRQAPQKNHGAKEFSDQRGQRSTFPLRLFAAVERTL